MEKLNSSLKNMVCVLVGVALVTGGLLAVVNNVTKDPKAAKAEQTLAEGIKSVMGTDKITVSSTDSVNNNENGKDRLYIIHNVSDADSKPIGAAVEAIGQGFGGDLKVLVGFSMDGKILGYTILQHAETPGLGAKAGEWFQKSQKGDIIGKELKSGDLKVTKDEKGVNSVDAITASTITSRAFLNAVNDAYKTYAGKWKDGESGATKQCKHN